METVDLCKWIRRCLLTRAAEVYSYTSWNEEDCAGRIREFPEWVLGLNGFFRIQPEDLTEAEMNELDFGRWEEGNPMRLIPLWLLPFLADEIQCTTIGGSRSVRKRKELDNDHRFGYLAYGVLPKDLHPEGCIRALELREGDGS